MKKNVFDFYYNFFIAFELLAEHRTTNNEDTEKNLHLE